MGRYDLTYEVREKSGRLVTGFLDIIDKKQESGLRKINLSDSGFNPYTLCKYMKELGYEQGTQDDNGWDFDFWIPFRKDGHTPVEVAGTGIIFELWLKELDYDWKEKEDADEAQMHELGNDVQALLKQVEVLLGHTELHGVGDT